MAKHFQNFAKSGKIASRPQCRLYGLELLVKLKISFCAHLSSSFSSASSILQSLLFQHQQQQLLRRSHQKLLKTDSKQLWAGLNVSILAETINNAFNLQALIRDNICWLTSIALSVLTVRWSRVQISSTPSTLLYVQILYCICHCVEKETKFKKRPGLSHI